MDPRSQSQNYGSQSPDRYPTAQRPTPHGAPSNRPPVRRKRRRRRRRKNILPALIVAVIGVVVIALLVMGVRSLFENSAAGKDKDETPSVLDTTPQPTATPAPKPTTTPVPTAAQERDIEGLEVAEYDGTVVVGDGAYEYYKYDNDITGSYINAINTAAQSASGIAQVHAIVMPTSIDIMLPISFLDQYADLTSDQEKASAYILNSLDSSIKKISVYDALKAHCDEDLFFRTDNHITGLGGYYIYHEWAYQNGIMPLSLMELNKKEYDGFKGNIYTNLFIDALTAEKVPVYQSPANLSFSHITETGAMVEAELYPDVSSYDYTQKYRAYMDGTYLYSEITNNDLDDGSCCIIVIDSNGTPVAPYFANHFQKVCIVDYRSYGSSVAELAKEKGATDIIFCTSITATRYSSLVEGLESVND